MIALRRRARAAPPIRTVAGDGQSAVDRYWGQHTVRAPTFRSARQSRRYLDWRFDQYPLFQELSGLWGDHADEVLLDFGCGPGNDLTGFALYTGARRLIGVDVSLEALELAARRLALHRVEPDRIELIHRSDIQSKLPFDDESVDHVNCQGVLHHTSDPQAILREFRRVMKPSGTGCAMVYNRNSVFFHLYTAYERMVVEGAFPGLDIQEAFSRNTDGPDCPISRSYMPENFMGMCAAAGLEVTYAGGYLSNRELQSLRESLSGAVDDQRLPPEHRQFLRDLSYDSRGYPMDQGKYAGIGGVYRFGNLPPS
jgi:SAM-dependent methyltransferase